jgi:hypothetical protein
VSAHYIGALAIRMLFVTQLLIGTYRKRKHITACLRAVEERLSGYDDVIRPSICGPR